MKIFLEHLQCGYETAIRNGFAFLGADGKVSSSDHVAIKPNLTFPEFRKGVMTNPEAVCALIAYLKNFTDKITICESDSGGYNPFSMDEVFRKTGILEAARYYGVEVVNLSHAASSPIHFRYRLKKFSLPLPTRLTQETDLFITMPVPKVHANTGVSIALKNQWGIIQEPAMRLKLHPYFQEVIYRVNKALPRTIAVVDGKYGLTRNGPMRGDVVQLDWVLIGDNIFCVDLVTTTLMGLDWQRVGYLKYIFRKERIRDLRGIEFSCDYQQFRCHDFYLARQWTDLPGFLAFKSRIAAYIGYESTLAQPLHWLLYKFREPFY